VDELFNVPLIYSVTGSAVRRRTEQPFSNFLSPYSCKFANPISTREGGFKVTHRPSQHFDQKLKLQLISCFKLNNGAIGGT
jgi:hypothetical protein